MRIGIIDRFEDDLVVVEVKGGSVNVPRHLMPVDAREGDVVVKGQRRWRVDRAATDKIQREVRHLADRIWD